MSVIPNSPGRSNQFHQRIILFISYFHPVRISEFLIVRIFFYGQRVVSTAGSGCFTKVQIVFLWTGSRHTFSIWLLNDIFYSFNLGLFFIESHCRFVLNPFLWCILVLLFLFFFVMFYLLLAPVFLHGEPPRWEVRLTFSRGVSSLRLLWSRAALHHV